MIGMPAHLTGMDSAAFVAVFGLGWLLGSLATAGYLRKVLRPKGR
jgi:hypothetical protein